MATVHSTLARNPARAASSRQQNPGGGPTPTAWVRCPPGRAWGVVHFVGGAVLGSYPHIAYDAFLRRLGDDAGAAEQEQCCRDGRRGVSAVTLEPLEPWDLQQKRGAC